jgi:hypothetical protein
MSKHLLKSIQAFTLLLLGVVGLNALYYNGRKLCSKPILLPTNISATHVMKFNKDLSCNNFERERCV